MNTLRSVVLDASHREAVTAGVQIVRKIFAAGAHPGGLTTHQVYKLALQEPIPPGYKPYDLPALRAYDAKVPIPAHPEHPVRSITFLKNSILPVLSGSREIKMMRLLRTPSQPAVVTKGKMTTPSAVTPVWAWTKVDESLLAKLPIKKQQSSLPSEIGIGMDLGHLSRRRARTRQEKLRKDLKFAEQLRSDLGSSHTAPM